MIKRLKFNLLEKLLRQETEAGGGGAGITLNAVDLADLTVRHGVITRRTNLDLALNLLDEGDIDGLALSNLLQAADGLVEELLGGLKLGELVLEGLDLLGDIGSDGRLSTSLLASELLGSLGSSTVELLLEGLKTSALLGELLLDSGGLLDEVVEGLDLSLDSLHVLELGSTLDASLTSLLLSLLEGLLLSLGLSSLGSTVEDLENVDLVGSNSLGLSSRGGLHGEDRSDAVELLSSIGAGLLGKGINNDGHLEGLAVQDVVVRAHGDDSGGSVNLGKAGELRNCRVERRGGEEREEGEVRCQVEISRHELTTIVCIHGQFLIIHAVKAILEHVSKSKIR